MATFDSQKVVNWYHQHGRKHLPWQPISSQKGSKKQANPYHVWLSEIMLQQTQVVKVMEYFDRFISALPTLESLAQADEQTVMALWSGLGYYNRARNLHKAAKQCVELHQGELPQSREALEALSGIGRSTAAAIMSLAFDKPEPIMDGNVKRVFARQFLVKGEPNKASTLKQFWALAEQHANQTDPAAYTQGLMDLGATLCKKSKPDCSRCPIESSCLAKGEDVIADYPEKKKKVKQTTLNLYVRLEACSDDTLSTLQLEQRPSKGIWPKLWFFPLYEVEPKEPPLFVITHKLTHRILQLHVYPQTHTQQNIAIKDSQSKRIQRSELLKYPHPKALTHILNHYDNHHLP
ncbi:A/G-specific adenine glycosylase [Marinicella rhabdoformis]|uniref:A/G-specific adenine glycosylase n=1 Tax=Marinicella rhabdoformis TaxID=2580566 RepID=UPI0015D0290E|nr:A/G-specific adenine glycosylase [Marinicella rhabdoformis]